MQDVSGDQVCRAPHGGIVALYPNPNPTSPDPNPDPNPGPNSNPNQSDGRAAGIDNLLYSADAEFSCFADMALTSPADYYKEGEGSLMQARRPWTSIHAASAVHARSMTPGTMTPRTTHHAPCTMHHAPCVACAMRAMPVQAVFDERAFSRSEEQIVADCIAQMHKLFPSSKKLECTCAATPLTPHTPSHTLTHPYTNLTRLAPPYYAAGRPSSSWGSRSTARSRARTSTGPRSRRPCPTSSWRARTRTRTTSTRWRAPRGRASWWLTRSSRGPTRSRSPRTRPSSRSRSRDLGGISSLVPCPRVRRRPLGGYVRGWGTVSVACCCPGLLP